MRLLLTEYLDDAVQEVPDKIVFEDNSGAITYRDFYDKAQNIAKYLHAQEMYQKPIMIYLPSSIKCAVCIFGVLYSGNFYTIANDDLGKNSLLEEIDLFTPGIILTDESGKNKLSEIYGIDKYEIATIENICESEDLRNEAKVSCGRMKDVALVVFTSGSTGKPKGVVHTNHSMALSVIEYRKTILFDENTRLAEVNGNMFGLFEYNIFCIVACKAYSYYFTSDDRIIVAKVFKIIEKKQLNSLICISTFLDVAKKQKSNKDIDISCLRWISFAGAPLAIDVLLWWIQSMPGTSFKHFYGATEVFPVTCMEIESISEEWNSIPIGREMKDIECIVIGGDGKPVKDGERGELYIATNRLSSGYYNELEKTKDVFVQNPVHQLFADIVYRTGDIVKKEKDGIYQFVGRNDSMVKRRGYRIELNQIDNIIMGISGVSICKSVFDLSQDKIYAFYEGSIEEKDLYVEIFSRLRKYMIPDRIIKVDELPYTKNAKIDISILKKMIEN